ncbi:hypothetical protein M0R45_022586 [Rubus argutus]|uniref:Uncharacterized protein n=1 Tax=Rubus argutus TaxID=59490 RepID=A0AAW1XGI1_RUBAR
MAHGGDGDGVTHNLFTLLSSYDRDFLVRNNGDQVKISTLAGKIFGLYFSGSWCRFTIKLVEVYQELASKGDFEVSTDQGTKFVMEYGVDGYPFTAEKINLLKEQEEAAKKDQSLTSLLVSSSRDYLISVDGKMMKTFCYSPPPVTVLAFHMNDIIDDY